MNPEYLYVRSDAELAPHLARWQTRDWLAVDTEFLREDTYFPKLALVQISDGETPVCVDLQTVAREALTPLLKAPRILKVMHSASQDLEILTPLSGICPAPLFDTQTAAALLGGAEQLGYAALVEQRLGVKLAKEFTRLDWTKRPIPEGALRYAAEDVRYLAQLYPGLREELAARGRLQWLEEDCARATQTERYQPKPALAWQRLKGLARLDFAAQHRAARLAEWRETEAIKRDRPRKWIVEDELLLNLAVRKPATRADLERLAPTPKQMERYAELWIRLLAEPVMPSAPLKSDDDWSFAQKNLSNRLMTLVQAKAKELGIAVPILATRSDIEALVRDGEKADCGLLRGWRRAVIGEVLLTSMQP